MPLKCGGPTAKGYAANSAQLADSSASGDYHSLGRALAQVDAEDPLRVMVVAS